MEHESSIEKLLNEHPNLWKAGALAAQSNQCITSTYKELDEILPGKGWPSNTLMEFILPTWGTGELRLLMPLLQHMSQQGYWIVWLAPPHIPYAPYLSHQGIELSRVLVLPEIESAKEGLWAMEKLLHAKACGIVLSWPHKIAYNAMRRLQLAAETGQSIGVVFRLQQTKTSAAALRLRLQALPDGLAVEVIKSRGGSRHRQAVISW